MRERITYVLPRANAPSLDNISVQKGAVELKDASSAYLEHRLTLGLNELPEELRAVLQSSHELHVKWQSEFNYKAISPFFSRLPPGLHIFYTPLSTTDKATEDRLCEFLKAAFTSDLKCDTVKDSFSRPPVVSERFASSATYQLYHALYEATRTGDFVRSLVCREADTCGDLVARFEAASYVDFDYDAISHALTITAFWPNDNPALDGSVKSIKSLGAGNRVEVGILSPQKPDELEELSFGGYLTVVGEDEKPAGTGFSFPSRHHWIKAGTKEDSFRASFQQPTGLHPTMVLNFTAGSLPAPSEQCALHAYMTLPSSIFVDKYQLSDDLFLDSLNLRSLRSISGEQDLEAPDWATLQWGSASLLELKTPDGEQLSQPWVVQVPLHLRYLSPSNDTVSPGYRKLSIPWPVVFWACEAEEGLKMSINPFDRTNLGYDGLFGPKTMFYHLEPPFRQHAYFTKLTSNLTVPVLDKTESTVIPAVTILVVISGFLWILWKLRSAFTGGSNPPANKDKTQ